MSLPAASLTVAAGQLSLSPRPGRAEGDLVRDLADLRDWGADLLVSLTEADELPPGFAEGIAAAGFDWLRLPIADFGIPSPAAPGSPDLVSEALPALLARLQAGQRIALHCQGGCGRSGMVALRLMLLAGEPPDAALARLRAARPCAIETPAQLSWALTEAGRAAASGG